ncbi:membrane-bound lytic murein transglycosylase F [Marinobacterium nitratireducens]|uniref:Membrane-bound lytic murein transglycosylase F n=1 Tax=Marinobacterium nitratireducens TaxID=518897 RepID=A0A918DYH0_9GAMM|nr:membrane-bound lytic murein transglycosylase MltF [Marinobacterium nitratireducens]GGO88848.1 membrane-bound lytic murein transglycosylase F [Marinobacterium nitratireducens]
MMLKVHRRKHTLALLCALVLLSLPALVSYNSQNRLEMIQERGVLRLATFNTPSDYFLDKGEPAGFEYELVQAFARDIGVRVELHLARSPEELIRLVQQRDVHLAAAGLTVTPERQQRVAFGPSYLESATAVIYREIRGRKPPKGIEDLVGKRILVAAGSRYGELLQAFQQEYPDLHWEETDQLGISDLLSMVDDDEIDYTLVDSIRFDGQYAFYPGVKKAFEVEAPQPLAWMIARRQDDALAQALETFFTKPETQSLIAELKARYFQRRNSLNYFDTLTFKRDLRERFPRYEQYFYIAEQETDIDWNLLASVAYQESHWDPGAVSPTGVRGIMMLTHAAASEVGVDDRTDPVQSIIGGAHYLVSVKKKIPDRIPEPDHTWFALAGYNVGFGHLEDARVLTQRGGKNPDRWNDVREFLPLLTKEKYYSTVKLGYARGYEPVQYVANIQKYIKLLQWEKRLDRIRHNRESDASGATPVPEIPLSETLPPAL